MYDKLGRNEPCWCGSGKKYKRCHLNRETQRPLGRQEERERFDSLYEKGDCLHPDAGSSTCSRKIIKAHTIRRNGGLNRIARNRHVYTLLKDGKPFDHSRWEPSSGPNRVGTRRASTFTGFCARHDNNLFAPLEKEPFHGTTEQMALLGYRAICYETYMKERDLAGSELRRERDKGMPLTFQWRWQNAVAIHNSGVSKAIEEVNSLKGRYERVVFEKCFSELDYYMVKFNGSLEVMCSGTAQATHDFRGNRIDQLGYLNLAANWLTFSLIATDDGGAAVFSWPADHLKSRGVLMTLDELPDAALPHAIVRFTFEFFENTYFSPAWWDNLEKQTQVQLKERQLREIVGPLGENEYPRADNCLIDDGIRAVHWTIQSRTTTLRSQVA